MPECGAEEEERFLASQTPLGMTGLAGAAKGFRAEGLRYREMDRKG